MIDPPRPGAAERALTVARFEVEARRRRRRAFGDQADLIGDPIWDGLLELFLAEADGRALSIGSLAIAMNLAPTTGLRWITLLEERGLVTKRRDDADGRRWLVDLLDAGRALVIASLEPLHDRLRPTS